MAKKNFLSDLYDYQSEAVTATDKNKKGIVCMPTGTGKTFVQAAVIAKQILKTKGKFGVYVINAPRIMLSYQLLKEVYSFLMYAGIDARYMSVHSGGSNSSGTIFPKKVKFRFYIDDYTNEFVGNMTNPNNEHYNIETKKISLSKEIPFDKENKKLIDVIIQYYIDFDIFKLESSIRSIKSNI